MNLRMTDTRYENMYYKAEFADGGIKSLYDKELSVNLLNTDKFLGCRVVHNAIGRKRCRGIY